MQASVPEVLRPLMLPHLAAMEAKLRPGCSVLTWASMNIDGYLHYAHQVSLSTSLMEFMFLTSYIRLLNTSVIRPEGFCVW